jgi:predicted DNA-binding transcriptional regulator AlpA
LATLSEHICTPQSTIEHWVSLGLFPPPKKLGGNCLWSWKEVESCLSGAVETMTAPGNDLLRIREATQKIVESAHQVLVNGR